VRAGPPDRRSLSPWAHGSGAASGPARLLAEGLEERPLAEGHTVTTVTVDRGKPFSHEVGASFAVHRRIADVVREGSSDSAFLLVLAADCGSCVGVLAGLEEPDLGVVWLDAHGDFHTPETSRSIYLDGMGLAVATWRCWQGLAAGAPGFRPVAEERVVLGGAMDLDPGEREAVAVSAVTLVPPGPGFPARLSSAVASLRERAEGAVILLNAN
jgi:arginase